MSQWKMTAAHFKHLLEEVQDYKCNLTGLPLTPQNVCIALKIPRSRGGKLGPENVHLVHESIAKLAREYPVNEVIQICTAVAKLHI